MKWLVIGIAGTLFSLWQCSGTNELKKDEPAEFMPIAYRNPGLEVDLGVGLWAWPLPMDFDKDGDIDLVVSCPDVPFNGTYFF